MYLNLHTNIHYFVRKCKFFVTFFDWDIKKPETNRGIGFFQNIFCFLGIFSLIYYLFVTMLNVQLSTSIQSLCSPLPNVNMLYVTCTFGFLIHRIRVESNDIG